VLVIWFIKPEYSNKCKVLRETLKLKQEAAASIEIKKKNAENLVASFDAIENENKKQIVFRYLPEKRNEENIINGLKRLADEVLLEVSTIGVTAQYEGSQPGIDPATGLPLPPKAEVISIMAEVGLVGRYEIIKGYLTKIYKIDKFSDISSVAITRPATVSEESEQAVASSGILELKTVVNFGYLPNSGVETNPDFSSKSDFNFAPVEKILELMSISDIEIGPAGRSNPFISQ
jgi:hypothetical protein